VNKPKMYNYAAFEYYI